MLSRIAEMMKGYSDCSVDEVAGVLIPQFLSQRRVGKLLRDCAGHSKRERNLTL